MRRELFLTGDDCQEVPGFEHPGGDLDLFLALRGLDRHSLKVYFKSPRFLRGAVRPRPGVRVAGPAPGLGFAPADVTYFRHGLVTLPD